jgi:hypothetical protein
LAKVGWKFSPNMSQLLGSWYFDDAWWCLIYFDVCFCAFDVELSWCDMLRFENVVVGSYGSHVSWHEIPVPRHLRPCLKPSCGETADWQTDLKLWQWYKNSRLCKNRNEQNIN